MRRNDRLPFQLRHITFLPTQHLVFGLGLYLNDDQFISFHNWDLDFSCQQNHIDIDKRQWYDKILPSIDLWLKDRIVYHDGFASRKYICGAVQPMPKWMVISILNILKKYKISFQRNDLMKIERYEKI